jgi:single-stranded-DNA-specific exonuclease
MLDARTQRRWRLRQDAMTPEQVAAAGAVAAALRLHPLVGQLLVTRGIDTTAAADTFLHPKLNHLSDPAAIPGVDRAARRIARAIAEQQPIVIYGDYDVDGITASSVLWHVVTHLGARATTYVPHRVDEGYGLNGDAIGAICDNDPDCRPLIVSVDCGITAVGPARVARELGVDLIITDHHHFDPANLPDAMALVHPGLPRDDATAECADRAGLAQLCGAGVAFKLAWQIAKVHCNSDRLPDACRELMVDLLSLVALGTVADVVPLVGENRVLTVAGLSRIKHTRFVGLNALIDAANLRDEKVSAYHVGFVLGPRLNAVGRMGHAGRAVALLTDASPDDARQTAGFLTQENDRRRATERSIFDEARRMVVEGGYAHDDRRAIVVGKEGWHCGVVGIVASRLVDAFHRPAVVLAVNNGHAQGSARSVEGVSIHDALHACAGHLDRFGGHAMAAGLALPTAAIDAFRDALVEHVGTKLSPEDLVGTIDADADIALADCTLELFRQLHLLEPFGRGNPAPLLVLRNVVLDRPAQPMGQNGRHLSLMLRQGGRLMRAVAFGMGDLMPQLPGGAAIDAVFEPRVSVWQGVSRPELHIKDVRPA